MTRHAPSATRASPRSPFRRRLDQFGIGLAGLCMVHCIATLAIVSAMGLGGHFLFEPAVHRVGLALALVVAAVTIAWGAIRHRHAAPFVTAMTGLSFMGGALAVPHGEREAILTLIGVVLVSAGHLMNLQASRHSCC
ncbi:MerC domain-containing protein [Erythrobacter sp. HL-111]|uniref:MerC domain-containing protein n=1 Tax=Erythrobacter sp. HL-111 TaxID=1798193 RepID=UPI0006D94541|nr:MerC domain-containing protein [Erythrobacter sp. HL-111]KPP86992.1 MAG: MerC mercury resistance protein [Erythrobacteraceae bacterium HL-111]SDS77552.1 MerC mercury resistance protein [Erythrobacter sp. HL-111]